MVGALQWENQCRDPTVGVAMVGALQWEELW